MWHKKKYTRAQRVAVAIKVKRLARAAENNTEFLKLLRTLFKIRRIGEGCDRMVYSLPCGLVVKIAHDDNFVPCQNTREFRNAKRFREFAPRVYAYFKHKNWRRAEYIYDSYGDRDKATIKQRGVNIVVAERALRLSRVRYWSATLSKQKDRIERKFRDTQEVNMGLIGNRIVMVDLGLGRK
jgi:hypothetical protein